MIFLRSLIFAALFYLWSVLFAISMMLLLPAPPTWTIASLRVWSAGINWLVGAICKVKVEVRGLEYLPSGAAIVAPKHLCMLDVFAQFGALPAVLFVMKKELTYIPLFGWIALKMGSVVVDRDGHSAALKKMVKDAKVQFAKRPRQLLIFPEGTRGEPGQPSDYKPGIAALYRELGLPVHPVATNSGIHWPAHGLRRTPGTIVFEYLEPIQPGLKRGEFMRLLQDRIETASNRLMGLEPAGILVENREN